MSSSVLDRALKETGLKLEGDKLPKGRRQQRVFQQLISHLRAAESEVRDTLSSSERELNEALQQNIELQERVRILENENMRFRLAQKFSEIESLTVSDKTKLLEVAAA